MPTATRRYLLLLAPRFGKPGSSPSALPLQRGSNFATSVVTLTRDGHVVRWGRLFRSAAMPLLTERDYQLLAGLHPDSILDLRALAEREADARPSSTIAAARCSCRTTTRCAS